MRERVKVQVLRAETGKTRLSVTVEGDRWGIGDPSQDKGPWVFDCYEGQGVEVWLKPVEVGVDIVGPPGRE